VAERPAPVAAPVIAPLAVIRAAHVEYSSQTAAEKDKAEKDRAEKDKAEKAEKAERAEKLDKSDVSSRSADKPAAARTRELAPDMAAPAELEPGVADAVQTRVADAGH
jgi:ribonuclease-3